MGFAVGQRVVFKEGAHSETLVAILADEAVGMPLFTNGRDEVVHDGICATSALWRKHLVVVVSEGRV